MTPVITTKGASCKRCYSCVRRCPSKAIRVREGQAQVIDERCVGCGRCLEACPQGARIVVDGVPEVERMLLESEVVLMVAPSFPAAFPEWSPGSVLTAMRRLGFAGVYEVALGAELVSREYHRLHEAHPEKLLITTACPAAVGYIQRYALPLLPYLAPLVSPMVAMGMALKTKLRPQCQTVFVGPCTAKILEAAESTAAPYVDACLTFRELRRLFESRDIDPSSLPEGDFDPPHSMKGGIYPISGGPPHVSKISTDIFENKAYSASGAGPFTEIVERLSRRLLQGEPPVLETRFIDVQFCRGCIHGPIMPAGETLLRRKERVVRFVKGRRRNQEEWQRAMDALADIPLTRTFEPMSQMMENPTEEEIRQILASTDKYSPEDELNCRACGYRSCREKAVAVHRGLAELDMCLPHLIDRLQGTVKKLNESHEALTEAQTQLLRAERLASMGQLAAGIAHEINNPLGTILLYSHLLLESASDPAQVKNDVGMILHEATRCKHIVGGLLDFARQNRVCCSPTDLVALIQRMLTVVKVQQTDDAIRFQTRFPQDLPTAFVDGEQLEQVLLNLLWNAVEAMPEGGVVTVGASFHEESQEFRIFVEDTGTGILPEHMHRLFNPFFTTKPMGKGTGLGLPICYGIVKMHRGTITARNNENGNGACFEVRLPARLQFEEQEPLPEEGSTYDAIED